MADGYIERDIYIHEKRRVEPIYLSVDSSAKIVLYLKDFQFVSATGVSYTAKCYAMVEGETDTKEYTPTLSTTNKNVILYPTEGFFRYGRNDLQVEIYNGQGTTICTLHIPVVCESRLSNGTITSTESFKTLTERAETAAQTASSAVTGLASKQDKLTAGSGISIAADGKTISTVFDATATYADGTMGKAIAQNKADIDAVADEKQTEYLLPYTAKPTGFPDSAVNDGLVKYNNEYVDQIWVVTGSNVAADGYLTKIRIKGSKNQFGSLRVFTLIQFRKTDGTYSEIGRNNIVINTNTVVEIDACIPVKAGDLFGIRNNIGYAPYNCGQALKIAYSDDDISFSESSLNSAGAANNILNCELTVNAMSVGGHDMEKFSALSAVRNGLVTKTPGKNLADPRNIILARYEDGEWKTGYGAVPRKTIAIPVDESTVYSFSRPASGNYKTVDINFFDADAEWIGSVNEADLGHTREGGRFFVTPEDAAYAVLYTKIAGLADDSDTFQVEQGCHNTVFESYREMYSGIGGTEIHGHRVVDNTIEYDLPINLLIMGDSISYDNDIPSYAGYSCGYWFYNMINKYSVKSARNIGRGGARWTHTASTSVNLDPEIGGGSVDNVISNQIARLIDGYDNSGWERPDVILIHCGINDRSFALDGDTGLDYGNPDTVFRSEDSYVDLAFNDAKLLNMCGAIRRDIEEIWKKFPYCKIVLTTPLHNGASSSDTKGYALNATIKKCASYLACPVLDLGFESYFYSMAEREEDNRKYTSDGLHPNRDKGGKLLADIIGHYLVGKFGGKEFFNLYDD